jgi:hypothetical protein
MLTAPRAAAANGAAFWSMLLMNFIDLPPVELVMIYEDEE